MTSSDADAVVTHWDRRPRRRTTTTWIHTVGSADEARRAVGAGADAVIAQGVEPRLKPIEGADELGLRQAGGADAGLETAFDRLQQRHG